VAKEKTKAVNDADRIAGLPAAKLQLLLKRVNVRSQDERVASANIGRQLRNGQTCVLSFAQQRLWLLDQVHVANGSYNLSAAFRLEGALNVAALERAVDAVVARHEILRTIFRSVGDEPVQVISPPRSMPLRFMECSDLPEDRDAAVQRLAAEEARRPFDLSRGPLLRVGLIRADDTDHVLLLTAHHIIFDGWSMNVFIRELSVLYASFAAGRPSSLPDLPLQYADFSLWQRQRLDGEVLKSHLAYWRRQLGDSSGSLDLPLDRSRPSHQTFGGAHENLTLAKSLADALRALGNRHGATLFVTLLTAFQSLLHRYTAQEEINLGVPVAGRDRVELEGLIGFFVNTLVIRTSFGDDPSFRDLLARVRQTMLEALTHQDLPFEKLVEELQPKRDPSRQPLFEVMFQLKSFRPDAPPLSTLHITPLDVAKGRAQFDLSLEIAEAVDGLVATAEYNTDLFEAETIRRLLGHYRTLLESAVADAGQRVSELRLFDEGERRQLSEWNATRRAYEWSDGGAAAHVHRRALQQGQNVAVECKGRTVSYAELNRQANQLAHYLTRVGVRKGACVGLYAERSIETCVALLGILKIGAVYVPLDPKYPADRIAFVAKDAGLRVVVVGRSVDGSVLEPSATLVSLERDWNAIMQEDACDPPVEVTANDAAYVIYTSGSAATPKGVIGLHRGILNRVSWMQEVYPFEPNEVCCQKTSLSFVDSIWETLGPLMSGATLAVIPDETVKDVRQLVRTLDQLRVTRIVLVPSLLAAILAARDDLDALLPCLKYWLCSGEALPVELAREFRAALPHSKLINLYGSSEVAADATWHEVADVSERVPIGRPIANTEAYILDQHLRPLPIGVTGELHIGGHGLARGYLGLPALTAAKFVPNPFGNEAGARLYKSGDLARRLPDGTIEYVGRHDSQIKLRGFRIELCEIESALEQHPTVRSAVVVAQQAPSGEKILIAYVLPRQGREISAAALRTAASGKLPDYMIPADFIITESMALTPNGKIDRRALSEQSTGRHGSETVLPRTPMEQELAEIWRTLLKVQQVGIHDNFFALGGHSLLATQVITRVRDVFRLSLPQRILFDAPTIAGLADAIARNEREPATNELDEVLREVEALTTDEAHDAMLSETGEG